MTDPKEIKDLLAKVVSQNEELSRSELSHFGFGDIKKKFNESQVVRDASGKFSTARGKLSDEMQDIFDKIFGSDDSSDIVITDEHYRKMGLERLPDGSLKPMKPGDIMAEQLIEDLQNRLRKNTRFNPKAKLDTSQIDAPKKGDGNMSYKDIAEYIWRTRNDGDVDTDLGRSADKWRKEQDAENEKIRDRHRQVTHADLISDILAHSMIDVHTLGIDDEDFLEHYGTKGMRWGVTRALKKMPASQRDAYVKSKDAKWLAKVQADPKLGKVSRKAAREAKKLTKKLKEDYKANELDIKKSSLARSRYDSELKTILEQSLSKAAFQVHKNSPTRLNEVSIHRHPDGSITATVQPRHNAKLVKQRGQIAKVDRRTAKRDANSEIKAIRDAAKARRKAQEAKHDAMTEPVVEEDLYAGLTFVMSVDDDGFVDHIFDPSTDLEQMLEEDDDFLEHYGVRGMRWGVRNNKFSSSNLVISSAKSIVGQTTLDKAGKPAVIIDVRKASATDTSRAETRLGRKLRSSEVAEIVETQNADQQAAVRVRNRNVNLLRIGVAGAIIAGRTVLGHDDLYDDDDDYLAHYGVKGMRWGYRRGTGPDGLVKGAVKKVGKALKGSDKKDETPATKKPHTAIDHVRLKDALEKDVSQLSTQEIKSLNNRVKAIGDFKKVQEAAKNDSRSAPNKIARWALSAAFEGGKSAGEAYIKKNAGDLVSGILPDLSKGKKPKEESEKSESKKQNKVFDAASKPKGKTKSSSNVDTTKPIFEATTRKEKRKKSGSKSERDEAIDDLVYTITNVKKRKKGG